MVFSAKDWNWNAPVSIEQLEIIMEENKTISRCTKSFFYVQLENLFFI
jgi:hypothetical protein